MTRGLDTSLFLFPKEEWDKLAERLARLPLGRANSRALSRLMLAGAMEVDMDKQGRVMIPEYLRVYASMKKDIIVAGLYDRIELWDSKKWNTYKNATERDAGDIAEQLGELGL